MSSVALGHPEDGQLGVGESTAWEQRLTESITTTKVGEGPQLQGAQAEESIDYRGWRGGTLGLPTQSSLGTLRAGVSENAHCQALLPAHEVISVDDRLGRVLPSTVPAAVTSWSSAWATVQGTVSFMVCPTDAIQVVVCTESL